MRLSCPLSVTAEIVIYPPAFSRTGKRHALICCWLAAALCLGSAVAAPAFPALQLQNTLLTGPGWQLENSHLSFDGNALLLQAERVRLRQPAITFEQVQLQCQTVLVTQTEWRCEQAEFSAQMAAQPVRGAFNVSYRPDSGELLLETSRLRWGKNQLALHLQTVGTRWQLELDVQSLALAELIRLLPEADGIVATLNGQLVGQLQLRGTAAQLEQAQWQLRPSALSFSSADGQYASEQLGGMLSGRWRNGGQTQAELKLQTGQLLLQPLFWDFSQSQSLTVKLAGNLSAGQDWQFDQISLTQPGVGQINASARIAIAAENPLRELQLTIAEASLAELTTQYLEPFLAATALAGFDASGRGGVQLSIAQGRLQQFELSLQEAHFALPEERWRIQGLNGSLAITQTDAGIDSRLVWREGKIYRLDFGAGVLAFRSQAGSLRLLQATRIPLLDGALRIDQLRGQDILGAAASWRFSGRLEPISMPALCAALAWPELAGQLGGVIPGAIYQRDELNVTGTLQVDAFDGTIRIDDLRLASLFSASPEVFATMHIERLDLETLTRTFDFGKIEGKLNGWVRGLHLQNWQPVAFDARFFSPDDDDSRQRISQRAVESISSLGGGNATAALSRGFLGLFEEFRYKRLGIGCRLERGICQMVGIGPAAGTNGGYYLVEGSSLPRINVIAYNRLVDWQDLLARLQAAAQSEGPVVR